MKCVRRVYSLSFPAFVYILVSWPGLIRSLIKIRTFVFEAYNYLDWIWVYKCVRNVSLSWYRSLPGVQWRRRSVWRAGCRTGESCRRTGRTWADWRSRWAGRCPASPGRWSSSSRTCSRPGLDGPSTNKRHTREEFSVLTTCNMGYIELGLISQSWFQYAVWDCIISPYVLMIPFKIYLQYIERSSYSIHLFTPRNIY